MSIKAFVNELGGATELAKRIDVKRDAIYQWVERGTIPFKYRPTIAALAIQDGVPVPPDVAQFIAPVAEPPQAA
jgi:DNA-binding XRE family transcriptional regulator